jgi:hypothetical protein
MTLRELKLSIQSKDVPDTFFVFVCPPNDYFLATSYINAICESKQLEKVIAESIFNQESALSLVMGFENDFRVVITDTFEETCADYSKFTNTAVICSKVDKKLEKAIAEYIITVPTVVDWQVKDFIKQKAPKLTDQNIEELYLASGGNMYMLDNMLTKITLFSESEQSTIAFEIAHEPGSHLYDTPTYTLVDGIIKNDRDAVKKYVLTNQTSKDEFLGVVNLVLNKVKSTLWVEYSNKTAAELGMSDKQYYFLKNHRSGLSMAALQQKLKVLTALDLQLKSGLLDISNQRQIDYLITKLVS